mgnify:CR=1 FL=1
MERDTENDYLALDTAGDDPLSVLQGHSVTYLITPRDRRRGVRCLRCHHYHFDKLSVKFRPVSE